jgi:hypothetical protein
MIQLKAAYRILYRSGLTWAEILATLKREFVRGPAAAFHDFLQHGERGIVQERRGSRSTLKIFLGDDQQAPAQVPVRTAS